MSTKQHTPESARREAQRLAEQGKPLGDLTKNQSHQVKNAAQTAYNKHKKN